jgi:hypothetical protein
MVYIIHDSFANPIKQNQEAESSGEEATAETPAPAPKPTQQLSGDDIDF